MLYRSCGLSLEAECRYSLHLSNCHLIIESVELSFTMLGLILFLSVASAKVHHFYVGQIYSTAIHALELDDELRTLYEMGIIPTTTASSSLAIDVRCLESYV